MLRKKWGPSICLSLWPKFHKTFRRTKRLRLPSFEPFAALSKRVVGEPKADDRDRAPGGSIMTRD